MKRAVALACVLWLFPARLLATEAVVDSLSNSFSAKYHLEHYIVDINDVTVATNAVVYLSDDDTVYVSDDDLDAWNLKRPRTSAFDHGNHRYFGLQTDLELATSFNKHDLTLEIIAPPGSFRGEPDTERPKLTPGRGGFMNYNLNTLNQRYDLFAVSQGGIYQLGLLSTTSTDAGLQFQRASLRWLQLDQTNHRIVIVGDGQSNGGWLGDNVQFGGVHYATDYTADPQIVTQQPPTVTGYANSPSLLEVYINNVLEIRRYIPQGPFSVTDLPAWAATGNIVLVLTDAQGNKTTQEERPSYNPSFLSRGTSDFRIDTGVARQNAGTPTEFYRGFVGQSAVRYGITNKITGEILAQSINGDNFGSAGADFALGTNNSLGFRLGTGNQNHSSEYRLNVQNGGFGFEEQLQFSSEAKPPIEGEDFDNVTEQIEEHTKVNFTLGPKLAFNLSFDRLRSNTGSDQSAVSLRASTNIGVFSIWAQPFYDFVHRMTSANTGIDLRLDAIHSISETTAIPSSGQTSAAVTWTKSQADPDDPITMRVKYTAKASQDKEFYIEDAMPWAVSSFTWQQQAGTSTYSADLVGALALVGGNFYALRNVSESESFGVLQIPGVNNVRIKVNGSDAGVTNSHGTLLLRGLQPYRDNSIDVNAADVPIWYNFDDPVSVVPQKAAPVRLTSIVKSRGSFTFAVLDEEGVPLAAASEITSGSKRYPVGYDGRVFVAGVGPGTVHFDALANGQACTIALEVPKDLTTIPDLGSARCLRKSVGALR